MSAVKRALRQRRLALIEKPRYLPPLQNPEPELIVAFDWGREQSQTVITLAQLDHDLNLKIVEAFAPKPQPDPLAVVTQMIREQINLMVMREALTVLYEGNLRGTSLGSLLSENATRATGDGPLKLVP